MSETYGLTPENLLASLPRVLQEDKSMYALASSVARLLSARARELDALRIYAQIDTLPEELLDILAYDFKVDWWNGDYTLEEKRRTLKDSWRVHRMLGTKAAAETAISAIYPNTQVQEWFEYGGQPYFFRVIIDATNEGISKERRDAVLNRVKYYKNLRSHLEEVAYQITPENDCTAHFGIALAGIELSATIGVVG